MELVGSKTKPLNHRNLNTKSSNVMRKCFLTKIPPMGYSYMEPYSIGSPVNTSVDPDFQTSGTRSS